MPFTERCLFVFGDTVWIQLSHLCLVLILTGLTVVSVTVGVSVSADRRLAPLVATVRPSVSPVRRDSRESKRRWFCFALGIITWCSWFTIFGNKYWKREKQREWSRSWLTHRHEDSFVNASSVLTHLSTLFGCCVAAPSTFSLLRGARPGLYVWPRAWPAVEVRGAGGSMERSFC